MVLQIRYLLFGLLFGFGTFHCSAPPTPLAQLTPAAPLPVLPRTGAQLRNYTYTNGQLIFNPQNIRLGSSSTSGGAPPFPKTNKGTQLCVWLNQQERQWSNENIFDFPLPDGDHELHAFLTGSYLESVKIPEAVFSKSITVRQGQLARSKDLMRPTVLYNLPLGEHHLRPSDSLLVDFVLVHTELASNGNQLLLQLDDQSPWTVSEWRPYVLSQLSSGTHRLRLTLVNAQGKALAAPVDGVFTVVSKETEATK